MPKPTLRVLAVLELLQSRGRLSGAELAAHLAVDRRTVRRYIALLEEMGIPITTEQGRHGGYLLVAGFKLPPMMFTDDEALALGVGLRASHSLGLAEAAPAVSSAQAKLERVMPAGLRRRLAAVAETVTLELTRPPGTFSSQVLSTLSAAAQTRTQVHMHYRTPQGEQTERRFDAYGLAYRAGRWYAVGMCHLRQGLRSFRLDRVRAVHALESGFTPPRDFDALAYLKQSVATLPRAHTVEVVLKTDLQTAQRELFSAFGVLEWTGSDVLLRSQADDLNWFARELARLPFDFDIREPPALRDAVHALGARLAAIRTGIRE